MINAEPAFAKALKETTELAATATKPVDDSIKFTGTIDKLNRSFNIMKGAVAMSNNLKLKDIKPASAFTGINKNAFQQLGNSITSSHSSEWLFYFSQNFIFVTS